MFGRSRLPRYVFAHHPLVNTTHENRESRHGLPRSHRGSVAAAQYGVPA